MVREISATAAAPGIAIAPVYHHRIAPQHIPDDAAPVADVEQEVQRFDGACTRAYDALLALKRKLAPEKDWRASGITGIYDAHMALVKDPNIRRDVVDLITAHKLGAEIALQRVVSRYEEVFRSIDNPTVRERASDIRDVGRQIRGMLMEQDRQELPAHGEDCILAVDEFLPSDAAIIDAHQVRGIIMAEGGKYSHGAILARSFGIPCLVGLEQNLAKIPAGCSAILDGDRGRLVLDPSPEVLERYRERLAERREAERRLFEVRLSPSVTRDGVPVQLLANIEGLRELDSLEEGMFGGVGLFRTEFAFMERLMFPSEEEQVKLYREVVERLGGRRVTFRTLDVGGDKPLAYLRTPKERNPVLGWRGIRLTLHWQDIFYTQLRALVRASAYGPVSILLPMVTTIDEVRAGRVILDKIVEDLRAASVSVGEDLSYGVMVEVPAFATMLPRVLGAVDFVSVGSNDLVQYLLAVDRDNPRVAAMYDPCHPGVLQVLASCAKAASDTGVECSLCGEIAGESDLIPLLLGMGFRTFSMSPVFLPRVKLAVRSADLARCEELWRRVSTLGSAEDVREVLREAARKNGKA